MLPNPSMHRICMFPDLTYPMKLVHVIALTSPIGLMEEEENSGGATTTSLSSPTVDGPAAKAVGSSLMRVDILRNCSLPNSSRPHKSQRSFSGREGSAGVNALAPQIDYRSGTKLIKV
ncbi:hypothetical protein GW17_00027482 [Ensete ventricosum]|nr:hypothetical protein GW17_00027482 [Ensete ventricosum]RZR92435.1 hypothetical protein BHM03_00020729 [Ensete ventricosum]